MKNTFSTKLDAFSCILAGICFLFLTIIGLFAIGYTLNHAEEYRITDLRNAWNDEYGNTFVLNTFQKTEINGTEGQKIYYTLPSIPTDSIIMFRCRNMFVNIYVDEELLYEDNQELHTIYGSSPGSRWHSLTLNSSEEPRTICIEGFACYENSDGLIDNIYFGDSFGVYHKIVRNRFLSFITSIFMLLIGIILLILSFSFRSRKSMSIDLFLLGFGVLNASIWACIESLLFQLFITHSEVVHIISYISLVMVPLPFALLAAHRFKGKGKLISQVYALINCINIMLTTYLHATGIKEYHYILTPTHILIGLLIPLLFALMMSYVNYKEKKRKTMYLLIPVLIVFAVCLFVALVEYTLGWFSNYSDYTQIAMLSFLTCLVFYHIHEMLDMLQKGMQADMLHKLALTDYLTGLYNRTAFAEHKDNYLNKLMNNSLLGIIQFDVNNLKTVNDTLGHEKGDLLIQLVAKGLLASFSQNANCYRMGGDEFLVILTGNDPEKDYETGIRQLQEYCSEYNTKPDIDFVLEIAHGFVTAYNISLSEAMEKADILMYENKKKLKEKHGRS